MKTAKGDGGIGRTEIPDGPAAHAIPCPHGEERRIEHIKVPELPLEYPLKKFLNPHQSAKI